MSPEMVAALRADAELALLVVRRGIARFGAIPPRGGTFRSGVLLAVFTVVEENLVLLIRLAAGFSAAEKPSPPKPPPAPAGATLN